MLLKHKLIIIPGSLFLINLMIFIATYWITSINVDSAFEVNMAGRQRMLTQKLTKELLAHVSGQEITQKQVEDTALVFDVTLKALMDGGAIPKQPSLKADKQFVQGASPKIYEQLQKTQFLWIEYKSNVEKVLEDQGDLKALSAVQTQNIPLLKAMNEAVGMMQEESEDNIKFLLGIQTLGVFLCLLALILAFIVVRNILRRLKYCMDGLNTFGEGDFTHNAIVEGNDELSSIAHSLNESTAKIGRGFFTIAQQQMETQSVVEEETATAKHLLEQIESVMENVTINSEASEHLMGEIKNANESVQNIRGEVNSVASSAEELTASFASVADRSSSMAERVNAIELDGNRSKDKVESLLISSKNIFKVLDTINDIASKIDLLALNATIEAASAGDAGEGFAVVASEVKDLAQKTAEATKNIESNLKGLQGVSEQVAEAFNQINDHLSELSQETDSISSMTQQQTSVSREVSQAMARVIQSLDVIVYKVDSSLNSAERINEAQEDTKERMQASASANRQSLEGQERIRDLSNATQNLIDRFQYHREGDSSQ